MATIMSKSAHDELMRRNRENDEANHNAQLERLARASSLDPVDGTKPGDLPRNAHGMPTDFYKRVLLPESLEAELFWQAFNANPTNTNPSTPNMPGGQHVRMLLEQVRAAIIHLYESGLMTPEDIARSQTLKARQAWDENAEAAARKERVRADRMAALNARLAAERAAEEAKILEETAK